MPTEPEPDSEDGDDIRERERRELMGAIYGDYFRDEATKPRHSFFPLDIRRCDRLQEGTWKKRMGPSPLLDFEAEGEVEVDYPWRDPARQYSVIKNDDPWWVEATQEKLRDIPPRRWPPLVPEAGPGDDGTLLYTDDRKWQEERINDLNNCSRYFATNLDGRTLIINGIEVRKGCIAGPMPNFAVIECPGNQVAFWWGPGGRKHGAQEGLTNTESHWEILRSMPGFENIGLTAGQVWRKKIIDRIRREQSGNRLIDDEEWEMYKSAEEVVAPPPLAITGGSSSLSFIVCY